MLASSLLALALYCPHGQVRFVDSAAAADFVVRFVRSEATADCVVREVGIDPRPGEWAETDGIADFTVYVTDGIADFTVYLDR